MTFMSVTTFPRPFILIMALQPFYKTALEKTNEVSMLIFITQIPIFHLFLPLKNADVLVCQPATPPANTQTTDFFLNQHYAIDIFTKIEALPSRSA